MGGKDFTKSQVIHYTPSLKFCFSQFLFHARFTQSKVQEETDGHKPLKEIYTSVVNQKVINNTVEVIKPIHLFSFSLQEPKETEASFITSLKQKPV